ncbi:MAG: hypothetical protein WCG13_08725 [Burkholderiales bacterium]
MSVLTGLVVVGILAAITMPTYASYTRRVYISQGLELAMPAKAAATEYYELNKGKSRPSRPLLAMALPEDGGPPPLPAPELIEAWPSKQVEALYRADTLVVVKYAPAVDPDGVKRYYLVLKPSGGAGGTVWACLSDAAAKAAMDSAQVGVPGAEPMPASLAGTVCR